MEFGNRGADRSPMSQINITPLVDVMLVLLVIFMITAPMMQQGMEVNLPKAGGKSITANEESVIVTVDRGGRLFINREETGPEEFRQRLLAATSRTGKREVLLKADRDVSYGLVVQTMAQIKQAGIERLGMITEPDQRQ
jgi:biopolymer transport protein TolR